MKAIKKLFAAAAIVLLIAMLFSTAVIAQEEGSGFSEEFDSINWDEWEHSQDVSVENGVLRLDPGNFMSPIWGLVGD